MSKMMLDPQLVEICLAMAEKLDVVEPMSLPARGDALALQAMMDAAVVDAPAPPSSGVTVQVHPINTADGTSIDVHWYTPDAPAQTSPRAAVVYLHGGGMVGGRPEHFDGIIRYYVQQ